MEAIFLRAEQAATAASRCPHRHVVALQGILRLNYILPATWRPFPGFFSVHPCKVSFYELSALYYHRRLYFSQVEQCRRHGALALASLRLSYPQKPCRRFSCALYRRRWARKPRQMHMRRGSNGLSMP